MQTRKWKNVKVKNAAPTFETAMWTIEYRDGREETAYYTDSEIADLYDRDEELGIVGMSKNRHLREALNVS